ncbi:dTDP-4-dehydrorhamnose reductase [Miltoncostaea marina]|uniref:dTDP-4-dehydrorhamnose reductase n=1 Tax=Miltoncostaea marina TaxID=2843215 RepID=UPI001C3D1317|nr:dTDP-4-dehydrorhamnose reductase [Miltoncostaea marina]
MRVLVTGAAGMLGRDLLAHLDGRHEVTAVDLDVDVTDAGAVRACAREVRPEAVFHLAAWTDVDGAEAREAEAAAVNELGARNVAAAAAAAGAAMVLPSTDYVFDGRAGAPYDEDAAPAPLGAYGRTKLAGERAAAAAHPGGVRVARTAWLYGAGGRNFVDTMRRLGAERDEVAVVDDQTGSPTWTADLAPALEALLALPAGVYHTAGAGAVTWAGLARAVFEEAGIACAVRPQTTAELGRPAPRPACSALRSARPGAPRLRPWREALHDYIRGT